MIVKRNDKKRLQFAPNHIKDNQDTTLFVDECSIWTKSYSNFSWQLIIKSDEHFLKNSHKC